MTKRVIAFRPLKDKSYRTYYGSDLIEIARGNLKVENVPHIISWINPLLSLQLIYGVSKRALSEWLGKSGGKPQPDFIAAYETAMSIVDGRLFSAYLPHKREKNEMWQLSDKQYAIACYKIFKKNVEPPKQIAVENSGFSGTEEAEIIQKIKALREELEE